MPYTPTMFLCREKPIVEVAIPRYQNLETVPRVAKAINVARRRCRGKGGGGAFPKRFPWGEEPEKLSGNGGFSTFMSVYRKITVGSMAVITTIGN